MKIAHLLPYSARFPLAKYSGRYEWVTRLARLQIAEGHQVTIYAGPSSGEPGVIWQTIPADLGHKSLNNSALMKAAFESKDYDIYHSHFDYLQFHLGDLTDQPVIYTQHWFPGQETAAAATHNHKKNVLAVPPTHFMFEANKRLGVPTTEPIHHGIDLEVFRPQPGPQTDRLIFVGRIDPSKGVYEAVQIARAAGRPLDIVGRIKDNNIPYWRTIEPLVDGRQIVYLGSKTQAEIAGLLSKAKAMLFPSQAAEAFGLVTVEAQACGAPVIISDVGASRELVDDGKSGFVVNSEADYIEAIDKIDTIDRAYCRQFAERFDIRVMARDYERLYERLIKESAASSH